MFFKRIWEEDGHTMESLCECKKIQVKRPRGSEPDGINQFRVILGLTNEGGPVVEVFICDDGREGAYVMNDQGRTIEVICHRTKSRDPS